MKKTIFVVLMAVMIATPCFAQEIEPEGIFSIEGTRWGSCGISTSIVFDFKDNISEINFSIGCPEHSYGFYEGKVYSCFEDTRCNASSSFSYIDTSLVSIAYILPDSDLLNVDLFIMQPSGFGVYTRLQEFFSARSRFPDPDTSYDSWGITFGMGMMFKVENDWTPPESIPIDDIDIEIRLPDPGDERITEGILIPDLPDDIYDDPSEYQ